MIAQEVPSRLIISHAYEEALLRVYGVRDGPEYKGRGRPPKPSIQPPPNLRYAQLVKHRVKGKLVKITYRVVYGDEEEVLGMVEATSNQINVVHRMVQFRQTT